MKTTTLVAAATLFLGSSASAEPPSYPPAKVNYEGFKALMAEVEPHRQERLVDLNTFLKMSNEPGVVVLDTRSALRYERIHLKGAVHLSFPDFTQDNLRKVIPSKETVVLIYCNNNFDGNEVDFAPKVPEFLFQQPQPEALPLTDAVKAGPLPQADSEIAVSPTRRDRSRLSEIPTPRAQFQSQERPGSLALNVPTYITLYGYGYRNVYELDELVKVSDPRLSFDGTVVGNQ